MHIGERVKVIRKKKMRRDVTPKGQWRWGWLCILLYSFNSPQENLHCCRQVLSSRKSTIYFFFFLHCEYVCM